MYARDRVLDTLGGLLEDYFWRTSILFSTTYYLLCLFFNRVLWCPRPAVTAKSQILPPLAVSTSSTPLSSTLSTSVGSRKTAIPTLDEQLVYCAELVYCIESLQTMADLIVTNNYSPCSFLFVQIHVFWNFYIILCGVDFSYPSVITLAFEIKTWWALFVEGPDSKIYSPFERPNP